MSAASDNALVEVACPLCGSNHTKHKFWATEFAKPTPGARFGIRRCKVCGCGFLSPRPSPDSIGRYYDTDFYWAHEGGKPLTPEQLLQTRSSQLKAKARWLTGLPPGRLLDVGAQKGEFVHWMRLHGWHAEGQDFQALPGNPFGVPMRYGDVTEIDWGDDRFDVITAWAVLEHVQDPNAFMERLAFLLKPGGRLVVLVTNFNSIQARLFKQDDFPRHLTLFTKDSLTKFLGRHGLRVHRTSTDQYVFGGSLNGGAVYLLKRCCGYGEHEAMHEWRYAPDPLAFVGKWHGQGAPWLLWISRLDRLLTWLPERLLDASGLGFVITFEAIRS